MDPLVMTLRALQAAADNKGTEAPMTWTALNRAASNYGAPAIDYDRFAARWDQDPTLQQIVDRFDGSGLVIKTQAQSNEPEVGQQQQDGGEVAQMAKSATKRAFS